MYELTFEQDCNLHRILKNGKRIGTISKDGFCTDDYWHIFTVNEMEQIIKIIKSKN